MHILYVERSGIDIDYRVDHGRVYQRVSTN